MTERKWYQDTTPNRLDERKRVLDEVHTAIDELEDVRLQAILRNIMRLMVL